MTTMPPKRTLRASFVETRALVGGLSVLALVWAGLVIPVLWRQSPVENIARNIVAEGSFKAESLASIKSSYLDLERFSGGRSSMLRNAAVINLRLLEQEIAGSKRNNLDALMGGTNEIIRRSLVNSPADSFLWMVLFWLENTRNGFSSSHLEYLRMSYLTGANEGWVAVKRNRFALAIYPTLASDLAENAMREFSQLVGSNYFDAAADILEGPGWPVREALIAGLKDVVEVNRQTFSKLIYRRGLDLSVPGVDHPEWRPWH